MAKRKMKPCPFCGTQISASDPTYGVHYNDIMNKWVFDHWCEADNPCRVWVSLCGDTKKEVIERWNHRAKVKTSESL